jgi:hypothetical protein
VNVTSPILIAVAPLGMLGRLYWRRTQNTAESPTLSQKKGWGTLHTVSGAA